MSTNISILDRCTGAMLGSAIGDALGWPNENRSGNIHKFEIKNDSFIRWSRRTGGKYWNHVEEILPGEYSDDTQLILAVSRSLISGNWQYFFSEKELPYWLEYERGGGSSVKKAAKILKSNKLPWNADTYREYFNAGGNGAVMRILPHVIVDSKNPNTPALIRDVIRDSIYTHGHPRAILGATCYAYLLQHLLNIEDTLNYGDLINCVLDGFNDWSKFDLSVFPLDWKNRLNKLSYNYSELWLYCADNMKKQLLYIKESLKKGLLINDNEILKNLECFEKSNGAGDVAILSSLYFASKYANNPTLAIKTAAYYEGLDTDTIASITGGILGCLSGTEWIPVEWRIVQDYQYLKDIVEILCSNDIQEASKQKKNILVDSKNEWKSSPIGKICEISKYNIKSNANSQVILSKNKTSLGQTIYIKEFKRINKTIHSTEHNKIVEKKSYIIDNKQIDYIKNSKIFDRITIKKFVMVIDMILKGGYTDEYISKKEKIDISIVSYLRENIK